MPRHIIFRCLAVLLSLSTIAFVECGLRLAGVGRMRDTGDAFVGFNDVVPLFVLDAAQEHYEVPRARQAFFRPESFPAKKPSGEYRIFCFGGSTVQGRPYAIETSFTTWLELSLQAADSSRTWDVINCGGVSYASYRLVSVLLESLHHQPDLFIVYTGHNEFLEARTYEDIKQQPDWIKSIYETAARSRLYGLAYSFVHPDSTPKASARLPEEVDALLDYQGGLADYHRDDAFHAGVVAHYDHNLRRMVHLAREAGVPMIIANPVSNIRDTPPFKVEHPTGWTQSQIDDFEKAWETAKAADWDDLDLKLTATEAVLRLDPRHAEAWFLLARVHEFRGDLPAARRAYLRAKDEDICPLRMLESMHEVVKKVARQTGTPLVDVRQNFESRAELGLPGDDELIDHVHPRIRGHQQIAMDFFEVLEGDGVVRPTAEWKERQQVMYKAHFAELPNNYFPEAMSRLEGLQRWSQGRANKLK